MMRLVNLILEFIGLGILLYLAYTLVRLSLDPGAFL